jgi:hypothetical protein
MRPRFSLRTLFIITTTIAIVCTWFVLPTLTARRFLNALIAKDCHGADNYFHNPADRFLADWADKRWSFETSGSVSPWSFVDLARGRRTVVIQIRNFGYDQTAIRTAQFVAGAHSIGPPQISLPTYDGRVINDRGSSSEFRR